MNGGFTRGRSSLRIKRSRPVLIPDACDRKGTTRVMTQGWTLRPSAARMLRRIITRTLRSQE
jgi:hypothetical protein